MLRLGTSDSIKYGRMSFIVKMTFEQSLGRSVGSAFWISDKEHFRQRVQGASGCKIGLSDMCEKQQVGQGLWSRVNKGESKR